MSGATPAVNPLRLNQGLLNRLGSMPLSEPEAFVRAVEERRRGAHAVDDEESPWRRKRRMMRGLWTLR